MQYLAIFFAGALLCNSIPHLVAGLQGKLFPTPFAQPRGIGHSSAPVNFLWGSGNLLAGVVVLANFPLSMGLNLDCLIFCAGALGMGVYSSLHFGKIARRRINDA